MTYEVLKDIAENLSRALSLDDIAKKYVDRDGATIKTNVLHQLKTARAQQLIAQSKFIFGGYPRCGKTTELHFLRHRLKDQFLVFYIEFGKDEGNEEWLAHENVWGQQANMVFGDFLTIIFAKIVQQMHRQNIQPKDNQKIIAVLEAIKRTFGDARGSGIATMESLDMAFKRVLDFCVYGRQEERREYKELPNLKIAFNDLMKSCIDNSNNADQVYKGILVIIDDFESVAAAAWDKIIPTLMHPFNRPYFKGLECLLVINVPLDFYYSIEFEKFKRTIFESGFSISDLPVFPVHDKKWQDNVDQINLMVDVAKRKTNKMLDPTDIVILTKCAKYSGGYIFHFYHLLNNFLSKYEQGITNEMSQHFFDEVFKDWALQMFPLDDSLIYDEQQIKVLEYVAKNNKVPSKTEPKEIREACYLLLKQAAILKYIDSTEPWHDVHPAIKTQLS